MRTQTALTSILVGAVLALGAVTTQAADSKANGTWSWAQPARGGRAGGAGGAAPATPAKIILKLKADGDKLTGSITMPAGGGRRGGGGGATPAAAPTPTDISDGTVKGDDIAFSVKRSFNGKEHVVTVDESAFTYKGKEYRSLSAIAREISGTAWNGFGFFGLLVKESK